MTNKALEKKWIELIKITDDRLSKRYIELDPKGYFIIKIEYQTKELILEHYEINIDNKGRAIDPDTGQPIPCKTKNHKKPSTVFKGKSAKELGIQISEGNGPFPLSRLDHAIYIGRELQRAEQCLKTGEKYIQD